ncbi:MAG: hypothetical protein IPH45_08175 [Bacteroidales bacterium]|nr:hypothetical protein [Bacteroidales bacterium]
MNHLITVSIFCICLLNVNIGQAQATNSPGNKEKNTYTNEKYRFSVLVPETWKLYGQILDDPKHHKAIADWVLPMIYSDIEKTEIENSVSITAYHKPDIGSVQQLIAAEYFRTNPVETALETDSACTNCRIIYHSANGHEYKGKSYYVYRNEIGYVITFMATPGTYDKNLKSFEEFYLKIKYL